MNFLQKSAAIIVAMLLLQACKKLDQAITPQNFDTGDQPDLSVYIAIGDSQTAGYTNDGLYRDAQLASYPNIMASQFKAAGGGSFTQPLFTEAEANGSGYLKLTGFNTDGSPIIITVSDKLAFRATAGGLNLFTKYTGGNSNFAIPGIKLADVTNTNYGNINPYYERLLTNTPPNNATAYQDLVTAKPYTFFSCWLGNNDALGYATSGGTSALPTDKSTFTTMYTMLVSKLTIKDQKGVLATIPDVSAIPYFNTITVSAVNRTIRQADPLAALYINARSSASTGDTLHIVRKAENNDLLTLAFDTKKIGQLVKTSSGLQPYGLSPLAPVDNKDVLDINETTLVRDFIGAYNITIKTVAKGYNLALFDSYTFLTDLKQGMVINGVNVNSAFITGGVFSLDGVHLTPRGYAIEANEFIKAINALYGSKIKTVDVSAYAGVKMP